MTLAGRWPLHENSGSTAYDHSGGGNDGSIVSATQGSGGLLGATSYSFDGSNDWIDQIRSVPGQTFSITGWIYCNSLSSNMHVLGNGNNKTGAHLEVQPDSTVILQVGDGSNWNPAQSNGINTGTWHFVAGAYDGSTARIYIDAVEEGATSTGYSNNTSNSSIGREYHGSWNNYFNGRIFDGRLYSHALTPAGIQYLYSVAHRGQYHTSTKTA